MGEKKLKVGIDYHGVLNMFPFFKQMGEAMVEQGNEVHIITGVQWNKKIEKQFKALGLEKGTHYTHFASMTDFLIERGEKVTWKDDENPFFEERVWNTAKSMYCAANRIDMHFDDSAEYCKHFSTPYFLKIRPQ